MTKGRFITLEGGEGVGKTSNLAFIARALEERGIAVLVTREPGGTDLGEQIRSLLLGDKPMDPLSELLLMFAARAQHVAEVIRPALAAGTWVVSDRFTDASYAYQGGGRGLNRDVIRALEGAVQAGLEPDLTLLLDAPVDLGLARAKNRGPSDRFESETLAFFQRVRSAYLDQAERHPQRFRIVDASRTLDAVQEEIARHLQNLPKP
jgi:dTMP kinase